MKNPSCRTPSRGSVRNPQSRASAVVPGERGGGDHRAGRTPGSSPPPWPGRSPVVNCSGAAVGSIAVVVTAWRARAALPRQADDDSSFAAAAAIGFVYTILAYGLTSFLYRMRPF